MQNQDSTVQPTSKSMPIGNAMLCDVDIKVSKLLEITDEFIFPAYYSHEDKKMWKILNVYSNYKNETFVLCGVDEGVSKALDLAFDAISKARSNFYSI